MNDYFIGRVSARSAHICKMQRSLDVFFLLPYLLVFSSASNSACIAGHMAMQCGRHSRFFSTSPVSHYMCHIAWDIPLGLARRPLFTTRNKERRFNSHFNFKSFLAKSPPSILGIESRRQRRQTCRLLFPVQTLSTTFSIASKAII